MNEAVPEEFPGRDWLEPIPEGGSVGGGTVSAGPPGPAGPAGPQGPPGPAGPAVPIEGWWDYHTAVSPPPAQGQIRTAPDPVVVDGPMTLWLSARDDEGLYWGDPSVEPGDVVRLRGSGGAVQLCQVTSFELTVPGPEGYATIETVVTYVAGQIAKTAKVEVTLFPG